MRRRTFIGSMLATSGEMVAAQVLGEKPVDEIFALGRFES
jgi:hypothetical protein